MIGDKCPTCGRRKTNRSPDQNARYWALIGLLMEKGKEKNLNYSKDDWHDMMKIKFLGAREIELPSGKVITRVNDTHNLDTIEFGEFLDKVQAWAAEKGVFLDS